MRHLFVAATLIAAALAAGLPFAGLPSQFEKIAPAAKGRVGVAILRSNMKSDSQTD
jgi:hypothetical protein